MTEISFISKTVSVLYSMPYFAGLDLATLEAVANAAIQQKYESGQIVFMDGEPCLGLYIVQDGWLKGYKLSPTGREQVIRFLGPGDAFNEVGVLAEGKNLVTVQAMELSTVWIIQRDALLGLMEAFPQLCRLITQNLAKRVYHLMSLIEDLSLRTVEGRLAHLLLDQSREGIINRQRWATQAEIAAQLGTVPGVINRTLHSLADEGLIRIERHRIHILNRQGLEKKALCGDQI
jgi:CRP/FNR family transcriptional regulator